MSKELLLSSLSAFNDLFKESLHASNRQELDEFREIHQKLKEAKNLYTQCSAKSNFLELSKTFLLDNAENQDIQKVRVVFSVGPEYNDQGYDLSIEVRQFTYVEKSGKKIDGNTSEVYDWAYSWCLEDLAVFLQYTPDISIVQEVEFVIEDFPAFCKLLEATQCNPSFGALDEAITHKYLGKENFY